VELVGDPDAASAQLETLHEALAFDEVFLWIDQGLSEVGEVREGLELFAARVMPRFA